MLEGIILAAGASTRLANKVFMPIDQGRIVLESALGQVQKRTVVIAPGSLVPEILNMRNVDQDTTYAMQTSPIGVVDAIACGMKGKRREQYVLFGDNVYGGRLNPSPMGEFCSVVFMKDGAPELDWHDGCVWRERPCPTGHNALAGYMCIEPQRFANLDTCRLTLVDFLNHIKMLPCRYDGEYWYDVGTYEGYMKYLWRFR